MLIALWGSPEEIAELFVEECWVSLSSALCFSSDFCKRLCGQEGRVEFIKILKGKGRAVLNTILQRLQQAFLNWVCLFIVHTCSASLMGMGNLLSPHISRVTTSVIVMTSGFFLACQELQIDQMDL